MSVHINFIQRKSFRERAWKTLNVVVAITTLINVSMVGSLIQPRAAAAQTTDTVAVTAPAVTTSTTPSITPNPALGQSCGLDIAMLVDTSGSVSASEMSSMKTALSSFASAFTDTPTVFSLSSFNTNSTQHQAFSRTPAQIAGDIATNIPAAGDGNTNWDSGLKRAQATFDPRAAKANLLVIATDGSPNRYGYPTANDTFDWNLGIANAIPTANAIKAAGTRIVVVGIGEDDSDPATPAQKLEKMKSISGASVATTPGAISPSTDVIKVTDFSGIGAAVAAYAKALCGGKVLVQKQFNTNGVISSTGDSVAGFDFTVNNVTKTTSTTGSLQFDNVLNGSNYSVVESAKAGTKLLSATCLQPNQVVNLETRTVSNLTMTTDGTISCTFVNGFSNGSLKVTKVVNGGDAKPEHFGFRLGNAGAYTYPAADQNSVVFSDLQAGSVVSVNETTGDLPYHQTGNTCIDKTIAAGQQATCTITNTRDTGRVTFQKVVNNEPNANLTPFVFTVNGTDYHSGDAATLTTGSYLLTENTVSGYHFVGASGICSVNQKNEVTVNVTANGGTCTITNARNTGNLTVNKMVNRADGNGFVPVSGDAASFRWQLNGGADRLMGTTATALPTGSNYAVTENAVPQYVFSGWFYSNTSTSTANPSYSCNQPQYTTLPANITVETDATTSITLCNSRTTGTVTVHKFVDTNNDGTVDQTDPQGWFYGIDNGPAHIAMGNSVTVPTGAISITEEQQPDFHNVAWMCYVGKDLVGQGTGESIATTVTTAGLDCVFTNARNTSRIVVSKNVDVNGDGDFTDSVDIIGATSWTYNVDGVDQNITMGTGVTVPTAWYTISENNQSNFHFVKLTCGDKEVKTDNGSAYLEVTNQGLFCTYWNARDTGTVEGYKWHDHNGNGVRDDGDEALSGWYFQTLHGQGATSDNNGFFRIENVPTGSDYIVEFTKAGWINTNHGNVAPITVDTDKVTTVDFGNFAVGSIEGMKFNDRNGDGKLDEGENGLANWTIALEKFDQYYFDHTDVYGNNDGYLQIDSTTTDASGHYIFSDLGPGMYRVREVQQSGWTQTTVNPSDIAPLHSGEKVSDVTFGNYHQGKISGYKFDTHEHTLRDWEICLSGGSQDGDRCTSTNDNGYYEFTDIAAGTYRLYEFMQAGWTAVSPINGEYTNVHVVSGDDLRLDFVNRQIFPDLTVTKTDGLTTATAGQTLTYTMVVSNVGEYMAQHVLAIDTLPAHMTYLSSTVDAVASTPDHVGSVLTWHLGNMAVSAMHTITVTVQLDPLFPNGVTSLTNTIVVSDHPNCDTDTRTQGEIVCFPADSNPNNNTASDTDTVNAAPIISVTKTAATTVAAGQNLTYTITWSVNGNAEATNAVITDSIPAQTTFVSSSCGTTSGACAMNAIAGTISWNLGSRLPGATGTVTMTVKAISPVVNGTTITNTAIFDTSENTPVNSTALTTIQSAPSLTITKSNSVIGFTNPGKQATYTVVVTNAAGASDTARSVVLTDVLPTGFTYTIGGGSTKSFTLGDIAPGVSIVTTYTANISATQATGVYTNTATAQGSNTTAAIATSNVDVRVPSILGVTSEPTMVITKVVDTKTTNPGKTLTYTVTISNPGDVDLTTVTLTDTLPKGFTFADTGKATKTWSIGTLKANRQRVINYQVKVGDGVKAGTYQNLATVQSAELGPQTAKATVEVKVPQVLGLATTGATLRDYALFSFGISALTLGLFWVSRLRRKVNGAELA